MVTAVQRAGGALNVNVHFHTLVLEDVFPEDSEGALTFHPRLLDERLALYARIEDVGEG